VKRVLIGTPIHSGAHPAYITSLDETVALLPRAGWAAKPLIQTGSLVTLLRNGIAAEFLAGKADVLLWIDADEGWRAGDVVSLLEATSQLPIVGGVYRKKLIHLREFDWKAIAVAAKAGVAPELLQFVGQDLALGFNPEDIDGERGYVGPTKTLYGRIFVRAAHVGTGFLAVTRNALERIATFDDPKLAPECSGGMRAFFDTGVADRKFHGEDVLFCRLARKAGLEVWLDTETLVDHYGPIGVTGDLRGERLHEYAKRQARS
jgi:hypothetical protein